MRAHAVATAGMPAAVAAVVGAHHANMMADEDGVPRPHGALQLLLVLQGDDTTAWQELETRIMAVKHAEGAGTRLELTLAEKAIDAYVPRRARTLLLAPSDKGGPDALAWAWMDSKGGLAACAARRGDGGASRRFTGRLQARVRFGEDEYRFEALAEDETLVAPAAEAGVAVI